MPNGLNKHGDEDGTCGKCGGPIARVGVERIETLGVPLYRSFRLTSECRRCRWRPQRSLRGPLRKLVGTTPGITWRLVVTWVWVAAVALGGLATYRWWHHRTADRVTAPQVGDRWTISPTDWAAQTHTEALDNGFEYAVIKVTGLDADAVQLAACTLVSDDKSKLEKKCTTFPVELPSVARADLAALADSDAVDDVTRKGDHDMELLVAGLALCLLPMWGHAWLFRRHVVRIGPGAVKPGASAPPPAPTPPATPA